MRTPERRLSSPLKKMSENSLSKYFNKEKKDEYTNEILLLKSDFKENFKETFIFKEKENDFNLDVPIIERNKMRKFLNVDKKVSANRLNTINNDSVSSVYKNNFDDGFNYNINVANNRKDFTNFINASTFNTSAAAVSSSNISNIQNNKSVQKEVTNEIDNSLRYMNSGKYFYLINLFIKKFLIFELYSYDY